MPSGGMIRSYPMPGREPLAKIRIADTGIAITFWAGRNSVFSKLQSMEMPQAKYDRIMRTMRQYSARMAKEINDLAWEKFLATQERPGVSTHRLETALKDERNIRVFADGFFAGNPEWLDSSPAKYWRQIEKGYSGHVGREIYGMWGATLSGSWATSRRGNRYALAGPAWTVHGEAYGDKFQPMGTLDTSTMKRRHRRAMTSGASSWNGGGGGHRARIQQPIAAHHYYRDAFVEFRRRNRVFNLWREVVAEELGLRKNKVGRSHEAILAQF